MRSTFGNITYHLKNLSILSRPPNERCTRADFCMCAYVSLVESLVVTPLIAIKIYTKRYRQTIVPTDLLL